MNCDTCKNNWLNRQQVSVQDAKSGLQLCSFCKRLGFDFYEDMNATAQELKYQGIVKRLEKLLRYSTDNTITKLEIADDIAIIHYADQTQRQQTIAGNTVGQMIIDICCMAFK